MDTICLAVEVSRAVAFAAGVSKYGVTYYPVTDVLLAMLTAEERTWLATSVRGIHGEPGRFQLLGDTLQSPCATVTDETMVELIRSARQASDAEAAKEMAEKERNGKEHTAWLAEREVLNAEAKDRIDAAIKEWIAKPCAERSMTDELVNESDRDRLGTGWYRTARGLAEQRYCESLVKAVREQTRWEDAEKERVKAEKEAFRHAQIESWLQQYGTESQRERFDAGVLPVDEIADVERQRRFGDKRASYKSLTVQDVEHSDKCYEGNVEYEVQEYEGALTADQWTTLKRLKQSFPEAVEGSDSDYEHEICIHTAKCDCCKHRTVRYGVRVSFGFCGQTLMQEFAL